MIAPSLAIKLTVNDLSAFAEEEKQAEIQRWMTTAALYPFDLTEGPLLLVILLRLDGGDHMLLLTLHHIISDGWSMGLLGRELPLLYEARCQSTSASLPPLAVQYADIAYWQRQWLHSEAAQRQLAYWQDRLRPPLPPLGLPTDRPRTDADLNTERLTLQLNTALVKAVRQLSDQEGATLFMTLLGAFNMLLYRLSGQTDLRIGTLVANRQSQELENVIGPFANVVVLRTDIGNNPTLREVIRSVRTATLEALMHQELPFESLVRALENDGGLDRSELFQVMFTMQTDRQWSLQLPGLASTMLETRPIVASACDMAVSIYENGQDLGLICTYKPTLFDAGTIRRIFDEYEQIIERLVDHPNQRLTDWLPS